MTTKRATTPRFSTLLAVMLVARITLNISYRITYPFLPFIARGLGVDLTAAGLLVAARGAGGLASPIFGPLSDRHGRKRWMLAGLALLTAGAAVCAMLPLYAAFMAAFAMFGLSKAAYDPTMQAYIGDRVPYEQRGRALGIIELSWASAWLIGVPSAGWLIGQMGWQAPFVLLAFLSAAGLGLVAWKLPHDVPAASHAHTPFSIGSLLHNRNLLAALCVSGFITLANEITFIVYGAWMENRFGLSVVSLGVASIVIGIAEATGELGTTAFVDRLGKRRAVLAGLVVLGISYAALPALGQKLEWALGGLALLFVSFEFTIVSSLPLISELAPEARATAMAANVAATTIGRMIGSVSGTALFAWMGKLEPNAAISAIATVAAFGTLWLFVHEGPRTAEITVQGTAIDL